MRKRVLIVDDSATVRKVLEMALSNAGYDVTEAQNGKQALEFAGQNKYDLLMTDLNMPVMDGIDLVKELRQLDGYRFTPTIMLTTVVDPLKKIESYQYGVNGWLNKPFVPEQVLRIIKVVTPPD